MRLFVAAPVPPEAREAILAALAGHRHDDRLSWTRPDGWHATLAFVGEVGDGAGGEVGDGAGGEVGDGAGGEVGDGAGGEAVVAGTREGAAAVDAGPVRVTTGAVRTLGRRTLVVELQDEPTGALAELGRAVQRALVGAGLDVDERRVHPHLTLGRARRRRAVPAELVDELRIPPVTWTVEHLEVVQSLLGAGSATYRPVATIPLRGAGSGSG